MGVSWDLLFFFLFKLTPAKIERLTIIEDEFVFLIIYWIMEITQIRQVTEKMPTHKL